MKAFDPPADNTLSSPDLITESMPLNSLPTQKFYNIIPAPDDFVVFKYGKRKYLESFIKDGRVSFAISTLYKDTLLTPGQQDNEVERVFTPDPEKHVIIAGPENSALKNVTSIKINYSLKSRNGEELKYYIWCGATELSDEAEADFNPDCYIKINNFKEFFLRLETAAREAFPDIGEVKGCDIYGRNVIYHDPQSIPPSSEQKELIFLKDHKYRHQKEFRLLFVTDPDKSTSERINFTIGNLEDLAEIVDLPKIK